ncbi:hypothetical protein L6R50_12665 [Myxococcota bacterium]|nr:hypothetical protein [Myxococcota bacterium]
MKIRTNDEIVDEIRRRRHEYAESLGYDLKRITRDLQRQERESGLPAVRRPAKRQGRGLGGRKPDHESTGRR